MVLNIIVAGAPGAGKNEFIQSCCHGSILRRRPLTPTHGFGEFVVDKDHQIHFYEASPMNNSKMWEIQIAFMSGFVIVVDLTKPDTFISVPIIMQEFTRLQPVSCVVAANRYDMPGAARIETLSEVLGDVDSVQVLPCNVTNHEATKQVILQLMYKILESQEQSKSDGSPREPDLPGWLTS